MSFFNLPFGVRIAGNDPIDGDRYIATDIATRDALIGSGREFKGLQVYVESVSTLYILQDVIGTWEEVGGASLGATNGLTIGATSGQYELGGNLIENTTALIGSTATSGQQKAVVLGYDPSQYGSEQYYNSSSPLGHFAVITQPSAGATPPSGVTSGAFEGAFNLLMAKSSTGSGYVYSKLIQDPSLSMLKSYDSDTQITSQVLTTINQASISVTTNSGDQISVDANLGATGVTIRNDFGEGVRYGSAPSYSNLTFGGTTYDDYIPPIKLIKEYIGASSPLPTIDDKDVTPNVTTGNFQSTGITITNTPVGYVSVGINGFYASLGNGIRTKECYFSDDGGTTAKLIQAITTGDTLYWNGIVIDFDLDALDSISLFYNSL